MEARSLHDRKVMGLNLAVIGTRHLNNGLIWIADTLICYLKGSVIWMSVIWIPAVLGVKNTTPVRYSDHGHALGLRMVLNSSHDVNTYRFSGSESSSSHVRTSAKFIDGSLAVYRISPNCSFPPISKWGSLTKLCCFICKTFSIVTNFYHAQ